MSAVGAGRTVPLRWVDAFTDRPFAGNPAAVCVLGGPIEEEVMQDLATELGLSETAYLWPAAEGYSLRWFTPATEVDLCGHATLAAAHVLREDGHAAEGSQVRFHTRSGVLTARLDGRLIELDLPADPPVPAEVPGELSFLDGPVVAGARSEFFFVAVLASDAAVASVRPDRERIAALPDKAVIVTGPGSGDVDYVLRVFGPNVGIDEDPVTGSAHCALGPYWAGRLGRTDLTAAQLSARGGRVRVRPTGDRVGVAGPAVTVLRGDVGLG